MLSPETNATTNATAEETMPGGRVTRWVTKRDFLLGAATATAGGVGSIVVLAAAAAMVQPDDPPGVNPPYGGGHIDPETLEHAQENAVTIYSVVVDENGEVIAELGHGSGFFIGGTEGRLIGTAAHVVDNPDIDLPEGAEVQHFVRVDGGELEGTVFPVNPPSGGAVDAVNDIAILDLGQSTPGYTGIEIAPPGSAELGENLWTVGTPADMTLEGTVRQVAIASLDGQRVDSTLDTEDVLQLDGILHGGQSGCLLIDSDGRLVGIVTHGADPGYLPVGGELTISYATRSERLHELLERYLESPEFIDIPQVSSASSSLSGAVDEPAVDAAIQQWIETKQAGSSPDTGGVLDSVPVMADPISGTGPSLTGFSHDDAGVLKNFLVIGDQSSVIGPWPPLGSSDDGGGIDSLLEALDALG